MFLLSCQCQLPSRVHESQHLLTRWQPVSPGAPYLFNLLPVLTPSPESNCNLVPHLTFSIRFFSPGRMPQLESSEDTRRRPVELPVQTLSCGQWEARGHGQRSNSTSSVLSTRATILQGPWDLNRQSGACWKEHDIRNKRMCVLGHHWPSLNLLNSSCVKCTREVHYEVPHRYLITRLERQERVEVFHR